MSIRSMTGFGLAESLTPSGTYRVEIRGVNNRFLEIGVRQPKFAANLEQRIKKELSSVVSRGTVSVIISCDREEEGVRLTWEKASVDNYMQIFKEISGTYDLDGAVTLSDLLHFSDFIKTEIVDYDEDVLWEHLKPILSGAIETFQQSRETEGEFIANELEKINQQISLTVDQIEKRAPGRIKEYASALEERVKKLIANPPDPLRMETEIALFADKLDISEECTRLRAHIAKFYDDLKKSEPVGKRMGFLLQEMNREANTIGSKANDMEISHLSVKLKENIEKIREQIQNIE
ncbi:MAG TPA: YicC/YloC family endoribonuclease [Chitinispirillaceae bacterium]|nr:YicC/YloC family endoribonuclease [Chitinispirillaceae bacterium]